jgi:hypothetical protein
MALFIVSKTSHIYVPLKKITQAPVVHTKVCQGYLGDVGPGLEVHTKIVLAMFDLRRFIYYQHVFRFPSYLTFITPQVYGSDIAMRPQAYRTLPEEKAHIRVYLQPPFSNEI